MHRLDLTPREKEVLALVRLGFNTAGIAKLLGIRTKTAKTHMVNIREKLFIEETEMFSAHGLLVRAAWERQTELMGEI